MTDRLAYFEWSAPEGSDLDDLAALWVSNPSMAVGRISEEFSAIERAAMGDDEYARERLGIFPEHDDVTAWDLLAEDRWRAAMVPLCDGWMGDPVTLAVETTPDRKWTSIGAAGLHPDGRVAVEVVEHQAGTDWVVPRLVELYRHQPKALMLDPRSPAGAFVRDLAEAGIEITEVTAGDYARACGSFYDAAMASVPAVVHHGQEPLDLAAEQAKRRALADAWVFDRRGTVATPLAVVTLARWGHLEIEAPPVRSVYEERGAVVL